jgi:hypothetical protein
MTKASALARTVELRIVSMTANSHTAIPIAAINHQ